MAVLRGTDPVSYTHLNDIFAAAGIAQKYNCALTRLDYQQEAGLMSSIPLGCLLYTSNATQKSAIRPPAAVTASMGGFFIKEALCREDRKSVV